MFALLFFMATGCSDDQEIFFEDYAQEEAPEVVHPDQRDKPYPREEHELYINPAPLLVPRAARKENEFLAYIIHSGFISGYQNRYGDNLKPPTNVYHRMTA